MNLTCPSDEVLGIVHYFDGVFRGPVTMVGDEVVFPKTLEDDPMGPGHKLILEWLVLDTKGLADYLRERRLMIQ
jgi:hypothetical protein